MKTDVIEGSGRAIVPRRLDHMVSVRMAPDVVTEYRALADRTGRSVGDLLRDAAAQYLRNENRAAWLSSTARSGPDDL